MAAKGTHGWQDALVFVYVVAGHSCTHNRSCHADRIEYAKSKYSSSAPDAVVFSTFQGEKQLEELVKLIDKDLSEPYSIFTYRYFLYNWPQLCILARVQHKLVGVIIRRQEPLGATLEETDNDRLSI